MGQFAQAGLTGDQLVDKFCVAGWEVSSQVGGAGVTGQLMADQLAMLV